MVKFCRRLLLKDASHTSKGDDQEAARKLRILKIKVCIYFCFLMTDVAPPLPDPKKYPTPKCRERKRVLIFLSLVGMMDNRIFV